jgi:putative flippase GtrA
MNEARRFVAIGIVSTLAYLALYAILRNVASAQLANATALLITAVGNTAANRRLTFGVRGSEGLVRHHVRGALVFVLTLALTSGALAVLHGLDARPPRAVELAVLVVAGFAATVTRYVALRTWVFARGRRLHLEPQALER